MKIAASELIINPDGSIYHLNLKPGEIATNIITVGDPDRVDAITKYFEKIEVVTHKREFKTVTGSYKGNRLTVISTGIGTDNIDIVFTELDALVNIDFETRTIKEAHTKLNFIRVGTSGALLSNIDVGSIIISEMAIGLEGLMHFYERSETNDEKELEHSVNHMISIDGIKAYATTASEQLVNHFNKLGRRGITVTATGFYGPQGRQLRLKPRSRNFLDKIADVKHHQLETTNLEMETAGIYGMAQILGHDAISLNAILANRATKEFAENPKEVVEKLIVDTLEKITDLD